MEPLYLKIKTFRENLKMSQQELAEKTGYTSRSSIAKIEKGEVDLPLSKIALMAEALNTKPSVLLGLENKKKELQPFNLGALEKIISRNTKFSYKSLSSLCKQKRIEFDWTEKKVAELSDIDINEYLNFENNNYELDVNKIGNILRTLNISIEFALGFISAMLDMRDNKINIDL